MDDAHLREGCAQQAVTHYGFCSLALANPAFGEASGALFAMKWPAGAATVALSLDNVVSTRPTIVTTLYTRRACRSASAAL